MRSKKFDLNTKLRVGAVSYLNTRPLVFGFEHGMMSDQIVLNFEYPSKIASQLKNNEIDIGLLPVAALAEMESYHIVSDYCIGTEGEVASVCLFSDVPLHEITAILLDYQSRTSVALLKILLSQHWNIKPEIIVASEGYEQQIKGTTAGLVIGDRAFMQRKTSSHHYDLGLAWKDMTGLPFVFAAWVSVNNVEAQFMDDFNKATSKGLSHVKEIAAAVEMADYDMYTYYTENINYQLNESKKKAMRLFLEKIRTI